MTSSLTNCSRCGSDRRAEICAKSSDLNCIRIKGVESDGYVPDDMGIGSGDYIDFGWCLNCGHIIGIWPVPECMMEKKAGADPEEYLGGFE